jgi:hypothetical protein
MKPAAVPRNQCAQFDSSNHLREPQAGEVAKGGAHFVEFGRGIYWLVLTWRLIKHERHMSTGNPPAEQTNSSAPGGAAQASSARALELSFCLLVLVLALFQLSENTADPDLWGHIVYGQEMIHHRHIPKTEIYSYTALGQPWVNHEVLAEIMLGGAHALLGGSGVLLLKTGVGFLTFIIALRLGLANVPASYRLLGWAIGALAAVEISYGFAARPQIFTALFLVIELALLRRVHNGKAVWAWAIPFLFLIWVNTHGGVLAGFGLLGLTAGMTTAQFLFDKYLMRNKSDSAAASSLKISLLLWLVLAGAGIALFCNPWKAELLRWLVGSVLWLRPDITEWNPTPLGWDHAVFFILLALAVFAWIFTRKPRARWEIAACAAFAALGWRAVRNAPLSSLVILALATPHLVDAFEKFSAHFERLLDLFRRADFQKFATVLCACAAAGVGIGIFTLHKQHPLTMEIPGAQYPNGAIAFMEQHSLRGKTLVFFDWGEMLIFHLPACPPSLDGRLDTCYSRALIAAQWKFYNDEPFDQSVFNPDDADLALLPAKLAGAHSLANHPGWRAVYYDDTAVLLARNVERFPQLTNLPVAGPPALLNDHAAFADHNPRWK